MLRLKLPYNIIHPPIESGSTYYFISDSGVRYEVRFGRKQNNILNTSIVFGVLNEEYEGEEYSMTNKFEVFRVMATIVEIVRKYMELHPKINCYEFTGEPTDKPMDKEGRIRLSLYNRYLPIVFDKSWGVEQLPNKTIVSKIR
ncbi:MAG: hypothetical protein DWP98_12010 [Bacteroidetes bacterium]|nr:MAG: hypothetical protein DWP98_12010 [Bacteroidota bacterium]MBL1144255.1 hypothetical protein [Bacteroidota bacterium]MCB0802582.1 hypothetical protein [Flavobacteriales bacterium]NOG57051.1 hypothetical protein [Bacteroidota bacterium]